MNTNKHSYLKPVEFIVGITDQYGGILFFINLIRNLNYPCVKESLKRRKLP